MPVFFWLRQKREAEVDRLCPQLNAKMGMGERVGAGTDTRVESRHRMGKGQVLGIRWAGAVRPSWSHLGQVPVFQVLGTTRNKRLHG